MGLFDEDIESSFFQGIFVFVREGPITGFDKIMIKSSVWVLRRIDSNNGDVQVVNGASGDRGGNRILLPLLVRLSNQVSSCSKAKLLQVWSLEERMKSVEMGCNLPLQ